MKKKVAKRRAAEPARADAPAEDVPRAEAPAPEPGRGTSVGTRVSVAVGIVALFVLATVVNIVAARTYKRWDLSRGGLFTLSPPTLETLRALQEPVTVVLLVGGGDPLGVSLRQTLEAYREITPRIAVQAIDPDTQHEDFRAARQRYKFPELSDVQVVVAKGDKSRFLGPRDLVQIEDAEDAKLRPRLEQALTGAIRSLVQGQAVRVCFTAGHGEPSLEAGGDDGLAALKDQLVRNNFEAVEVPAARDQRPGVPDPLPGCSVLVFAPTEVVPPADAKRFADFVRGGGSALIVAGPVPDPKQDGLVDLRANDVLALAGVRLRSDLVFEKDPSMRSSTGKGESLLPKVGTHPITEGFEQVGLPVLLSLASSLETLPNEPGVAPAPLLTTSDKAVGVVNPDEPSKGNTKGPLTLAVAAERAGAAGKSGHPPRVVVVASHPRFVLGGRAFRDPDYAGVGVLVQRSLSWLAEAPQMLDIPDKPAAAVGLRLTEEGLGEVLRYAVFYMPLSAALFGLAVFFLRRSSDRKRAEEEAA